MIGFALKIACLILVCVALLARWISRHRTDVRRAPTVAEQGARGSAIAGARQRDEEYFEKRRAHWELVNAAKVIAVLLIASIVCVGGCTSVSPDYVAEDRATYHAIEPITRGLVNGQLQPAELDAEERQSINDTLDSWELRLRLTEPQPAATPEGTLN